MSPNICQPCLQSVHLIGEGGDTRGEGASLANRPGPFRYTNRGDGGAARFNQGGEGEAARGGATFNCQLMTAGNTAGITVNFQLLLLTADDRREHRRPEGAPKVRYR
jgi:hypothetical protein